MVHNHPFNYQAVILITFSLYLSWGLSACQLAAPIATPAEQIGKELVFYYWADYFPQSVLDTFSSETGITVRAVAYDCYEEGRDNILAGLAYDVVILTPDQVVELIQAEKLAAIDARNIPNIHNISANFRDLVYDPGNTFSVPFIWGTEGLLINRDLVDGPVTHWADLWSPRFSGKVGIWPIANSLIPIALKTLGYSVNSEDPVELQAALQKISELKSNQHALILSNEQISVIPLLQSGEVWIAHGWTYDVLLAQEEGLNIEYILPEEGSILWSEVFIIPENSPNRLAAEYFLNFVLRPEISAQIIRETRYAMPNDPGIALLEAELRDNPLIFPTQSSLVNAEILIPRSPPGQKLFEQIWQQFLNQP